MPLKKCLDELAHGIAEVSAPLLAGGGPPPERWIVARASEWMQRRGHVVLQDVPYTDGAPGDAACDWLVYYGPGRDRPLWAEFRLLPRHVVALDDLGKQVLLGNSGAFALALLLYTGGTPVEPDRTPPLPSERITANQLLHLARVRWQADRGGADPLVATRPVGTEHMAVVLGGELRPPRAPAAEVTRRRGGIEREPFLAWAGAYLTARFDPERRLPLQQTANSRGIACARRLGITIEAHGDGAMRVQLFSDDPQTAALLAWSAGDLQAGLPPGTALIESERGAEGRYLGAAWRDEGQGAEYHQALATACVEWLHDGVIAVRA